MATLNPKLKGFWMDRKTRKLRKARGRVLYGGRASSKSWELAGRAAQIGQQYRTRFLCIRRFQNRIKDSVYTLIKNQIENFDLPGYDVLANTIKHENGTEFLFYGIERNIDEIKSLESVNVTWIEEAHNLTKEQWELIEPTIMRTPGAEVWISFNPRLATDFAYQKFVVNPPKDFIVRKVNYNENDFLSDTMIATINELKTNDPETFEHVYLGVPLSDDDAVVIRRSWVDAAIDFHVKYDSPVNGVHPIGLAGAKTIGYDVADSGDDKNATVSFDGSIAFACEEWKAAEHELNKSAMRVKTAALDIDAFVIYDSIGVGASTGSNMKTANFFSFAGFNAGGKVHKPNSKYNGVKNSEYFSNIKAQAWWIVADRLRNTYDYVVNVNRNYKAEDLISISSKIKDLESLITELTTPRRDFDKAGKIKVESKDDLKARGIASPNKADAFIMAASPSLVRKGEIKQLKVIGY